MPSVAAKQEAPKPMQEMPEGFRNLVTFLEKKIRNLEKKKNRLDDYQKRKDQGEELNEQQAEALSSMSVTIGNLELLREFLQQVNDQGKQAKKAEKRQKIEKDKKELDTMKRLLAIQSLLDELGNDDTKALFASEDAIAGITLNKQQLQALDDLYRAITPRREEQSDSELPAWDSKLQQGADNCISLLESRERQLNEKMNYRQINELIDQLQRLSYFTSAAIPKFALDEGIDEDQSPTPDLEDVNEISEVQAAPEPEPLVVQPQQPQQLPPPQQQQSQQPPLQQQQQQQQQQLNVEPRPAVVAVSEQSACTINDLKMQYKGQFEFILESEVEPASAEQQPAGWQPTAGQAAPPTNWADDTGDAEQGKSWNQSTSSWSNQGGQAEPQAANPPKPVSNNGGGSLDVFSSATQSDYLKSGDAPENEAAFATQAPRGGGGRGAGVGVPGGSRGRGFNSGGGTSSSAGPGGNFRGGRGRPPRGGMGGHDMRGAGTNSYRGGNSNWRGRSGDDGFAAGRPGRGGSDRGGSSSYNRPRGTQNVYKNNNAQ